VALLHDHVGDLSVFLTATPQGAQFPGFLALLAEHFTSEQAAVLGELAALRVNVEHINEIVAMQQSYASCGGVLETIAVAELIEDALRMNGESMARHAVTVVRDFREAPSVNVDKHKLMQILVNLMRNGVQSCVAADPPEMQLTVCVANGNGSVKISVADNGVGIPRENLDRIFNHGFTTKKDGHGFGLHGAANAAGEMGGRLQVQSDGPGRGATFTLELPVEDHGNPAQTEAAPGA
jgi:signal transduction histidine kinase